MIREAIPGGRTQITGNFTKSDAAELANALKYGSLPLSFEASEAQTVSASMGLQAMEAGLLAGAIGLVLVLIYALIYYRVLGILTALSLVLAGVMAYGVLVLLGRQINYTLDLAGIAGLIIGIGTTADSFVVYFERIKDEIREGRSYRSAVPRGWARARKTIVSGNAVTFLAAAVLYVLSIGQVKGFAFTLGLITLLDIVVVFLVTWPLVYLTSKSTRLAAGLQRPGRSNRSPANGGPWAARRRHRRHGPGRGQRDECEDDDRRRHGQRGDRVDRLAGGCADAPPRLPQPSLHRYRRVRGDRQTPAVVRGERRDVRSVDRGDPDPGFTFGIDFEGGTTVSFPAATPKSPRCSRCSPTVSASPPRRSSRSAPAGRRPSRSVPRHSTPTRPRR